MSARPRRQATAYEWQRAYAAEDTHDWNEATEERRPRRRVGLISPLRVLLIVLAVVAGGMAFYGMFLEQSALQLPISISGLGLLGVTLLLLSFSFARAAAQLGRRGHGGRALVAALLGGLAILVASGALAGAVVLAMLTASA